MTLGSCKKVIEKAQENAVIDAITAGHWTVSKYVKGATELTSEFDTYKFQFKKNNTVDAVKNNTVEFSGSWQADAASRTIEAKFLNAGSPLTLLNSTWTITNSTWTSVDATATINGENCRLVLNKE
jgi:hypothetical protein